jgi:hypothetical protein
VLRGLIAWGAGGAEASLAPFFLPSLPLNRFSYCGALVPALGFARLPALGFARVLALVLALGLALGFPLGAGA